MVDKTESSDERVLTAEDPPDPAAAITDASAMEALSTRRRRYVIHVLMGLPDPVVSLDTLADELLEYERAANDAVPEDRGTNVRVRLHHVVLPALTQAGVLEYDSRSRMVRYEGEETCEAILRLLPQLEDG